MPPMDIIVHGNAYVQKFPAAKEKFLKPKELIDAAIGRDYIDLFLHGTFYEHQG